MTELAAVKPMTEKHVHLIERGLHNLCDCPMCNEGVMQDEILANIRSQVSGEMIPVSRSEIEKMKKRALNIVEDADATDANASDALGIIRWADRWLTPAPKGEER